MASVQPTSPDNCYVFDHCKIICSELAATSAKNENLDVARIENAKLAEIIASADIDLLNMFHSCSFEPIYPPDAYSGDVKSDSAIADNCRARFKRKVYEHFANANASTPPSQRSKYEFNNCRFVEKGPTILDRISMKLRAPQGNLRPSFDAYGMYDYVEVDYTTLKLMAIPSASFISSGD